ncbi:MAG: hypothetical protein AB7N53_13425 [Candidatus Binatia bacterium]
MLTACALLAPACGRKTPVLSPQAAAPAPIASLAARNAAAGVQLIWKRPSATAEGANLFDLDAFVVERALGGGAFAFLDRIQVLDRDRLRQQRQYQFTDADVAVGGLYRYRVRSVTLDGYLSAPSNAVEIARQQPTVTPTAAPTSTSTRVSID